MSRFRKIDIQREPIVSSDNSNKRCKTRVCAMPEGNLTGEMSEAGFVLSENEVALLDDDSDIPGRISDARAARLLAGVVRRSGEMRWSTDLVRLRLREAARGCERLVGRVGPGRKSGFWPEPWLYADVTDSDRNTIYEGLRDGTRVERSREGAGGSIEISRILGALEWPMRYLGAPEHAEARKALQCWLKCEARNLSFGEESVRALGCSRRSAYRRRDAALEVILAGVMKDGIPP